jgi:hypothetical protein
MFALEHDDLLTEREHFERCIGATTEEDAASGD